MSEGERPATGSNASPGGGPGLSGTLGALLDLWRSRCPEAGRIPARAQFDTLEFSRWFGHLTLLERQADGDFRYRVYGTTLASETGRELTGRKLSDVSICMPDDVRDAYAALVADRRPRLLRHCEATTDGRSVPLECLFLPLADDGKTVDRILVASYPIALPAAGCGPEVRLLD